MFFILSKILAFLFSPFLWFLISFFTFLLLKNEKWKLIFKRISIFILIFFSLGFPLNFLVSRWEVAGTQMKKLENHEIGVVLSGMAEYNKDLKVLSARRGIDRIWQTISLYKNGKIKKILISGDSGYVIRKGLHEADQLKEVLVKWGIPAEDIIVENKSKNTYENAQFTGNLLRQYKYKKKFLLITSALHMPRAAACFKKQNLEFDVFTTDHYSMKNTEFTFDQLLPSINCFVMWEVYLKEVIGYTVYSLRGYL
jgi:uncharacterized SAM-binding protein YcdF (DUF218 family)